MNIDKLIPKFIQRGKRARIANMVLKKNKVRRQMLPDFQTYYKVTVIKTIWFGKNIDIQINETK